MAPPYVCRRDDELVTTDNQGKKQETFLCFDCREKNLARLSVRLHSTLTRRDENYLMRLHTKPDLQAHKILILIVRTNTEVVFLI
uniref:Uncharacterized protein n=1 Tax=Arundo donax TaxID=35708 RepID=A0A0A9FTY1_ARUDO